MTNGTTKFKSIKFLSWNVRGLNDKRKRDAVKSFIMTHKPDLLCIQETKLRAFSTQLIKETMGSQYGQFEVIEADGSAGGVVIACKHRRYNLSLVCKGRFCLTVDLTILATNEKIRITGVYGSSERRERDEYYREIVDARPEIGVIPWMLIGDFNRTLHVQDRSNINRSYDASFRQLIEELGLIDLPLKGHKYTWERAGNFVRLDIFLLSPEWIETFPHNMQEALSTVLSDHCPILCTTTSGIIAPNTFRFEAYWLKMNDFDRMVRRQWHTIPTAQNPQELSCKMGLIRRRIIEWKKNRIGNFQQQKLVCEKGISWLVSQSESRELTQVEEVLLLLLRERYQEIAVQEEVRWRQRAKRQWVQVGDNNTRFFHLVASVQKNGNWIHTLKEDQQEFDKHQDKARILFRYFCSLMGSSRSHPINFDFQALYSPHQFPDDLTRMITQEEIFEVIKAWPNNKSPGPDGFSGEFYRHFADLLVPDLLQVFNYVMNNPQETWYPFDSSYIALIPKQPDACQPSQYRPISLINGVLRIFSKILSKRLQPLMSYLVQDTQTGFIQGRNIQEGYYYAQQVVSQATAQGAKLALFKADIHKAFDTIDWKFLLCCMQAAGLPHQFVLWVEHLILKGRTQVLLNSVAGKVIQLRRGVRQGDPLSPYLFDIAIDFLARWMMKLQDQGLLLPVFAGARNCLLYADDTLVMIKAREDQLLMLKVVLSIFHEMSGLKVNLEKSELLVTASSLPEKNKMAAILQCSITVKQMTYLGLPLGEGRVPSTVYLDLIQKIRNKLATWKATHLSIGGRRVMINAVMAAIPTYIMSVQLLPKWVIGSIDKIRRRFLWHGHKDQCREQRRYISLANWELVTTSIDQGGIGIRNLSEMNKALISKWMWLWLVNDRAWWKEVTIMEHEAIRPWDCSNATTVWKKLKQFAPRFLASILHLVHNRAQTQFWHDNWMGKVLKDECPGLYELERDKFISVQSMIARSAVPFADVLETLLILERGNLVNCIQQLNLTQSSDKVQWSRNVNGFFTVKSMYDFLTAKPVIWPADLYIWQLKLPPRVTLFAWLQHRNRILTIDNLKKRSFSIPNCCLLCRADEETVQHMFSQCSFTIQVYQVMRQIYGHSFSLNSNHTDTMQQRRMRITMQFVIWRERCRRQFQNLRKPPDGVATEIQTEFDLWFQYGDY